MYKFVRIREKNSSDYGTWYLKPQSIDDVNQHWNNVCGREIREAVRERMDKMVVDEHGRPFTPHPATQFGHVVEMMLNINGGRYIESALNVEQLAYNSRIDAFKIGLDIYLPENMLVFCFPIGYEIDETIERETLEYPTKRDWETDDVRYMQWNLMDVKGKHWYAKLNNIDVVDKNGNMKWNTKKEAEDAAKWFVEEKRKK